MQVDTRRDIKSIWYEPPDTFVSEALLIGAMVFFLFVTAVFIMPSASILDKSWSDGLFNIILLIIFIIISVAGILMVQSGKIPKEIRGGIDFVFSYGSIYRGLVAFWVATIMAFGVYYLIPKLSGTSALTMSGLSWIQDLAMGELNRFFFVCISAPFVEEGFRYAALPFFASIAAVSYMKYLGITNVNIAKFFGWWTGFFISSLFFVVYHGWIVLAEPSMFFGMFVYAFIFSIGNYILKSNIFSIILHFWHNFILYVSAVGMPDLPAWFLGIILVTAIGIIVSTIYLFVISPLLGIKARNMANGL